MFGWCDAAKARPTQRGQRVARSDDQVLSCRCMHLQSVPALSPCSVWRYYDAISSAVGHLSRGFFGTYECATVSLRGDDLAHS